MFTAFLGRGLVLAGIVAGLLAVSLPFAGEARYVDDGTTAAFLITLLALTSLLPADMGRDLLAACAGSAAFGFFLFVPAIYAFDSLGRLEAGAWLGLCTALIPIGALIVFAAEDAGVVSDRFDPGLDLLIGTIGIVLVAVGIWLDPFEDLGPNYWNLSSSGHALGLLLIVLVVVDAPLIAGAAHSSLPVAGAAVLSAAATFGLTVFGVVSAAFDDFGTLGAGAWLQAAGGILLLVGVVLPQLVRTQTAAPKSAPAA
jgi:hypothetical protein